MARKNLLAVRRSLWKAGLLVGDEKTGGSYSRALRLDLQNGRAWTKSAAGEFKLGV
jgi:hypothetical protein